MTAEFNSDRALKLAIASKYSSHASELWSRMVADEVIDWPKLAGLAMSLDFGPLLFDVVNENSGLDLPPSTLEELRNCYYETAARNTLALHELDVLLTNLDEADIPCIVLKGAALVQIVYGSIALRPMVDLDLLVPFQYVERVCSLAGQLGFVQDKPPAFVDKSGLFWNEELLNKVGPGLIQLELHWHLVDIPYYARRLPTESLLGDAESFHTRVSRGLMLAPEDQFLHLSLHNLYHHLGLFSRSSVDVAYLIDHHREKIDWDRLIAKAVQVDSVLALQKTLLDAARNWYAPVPEDVLKNIASLRPGRQEKLLLACQKNEFLKLLRTWATLPGLGLKVRFLLGQMFPSRAYMAWRYNTLENTPLAFAYGRRYASGLSHLAADILGH